MGAQSALNSPKRPGFRPGRTAEEAALLEVYRRRQGPLGTVWGARINSQMLRFSGNAAFAGLIVLLSLSPICVSLSPSLPPSLPLSLSYLCLALCLSAECVSALGDSVRARAGPVVEYLRVPVVDVVEEAGALAARLPAAVAFIDAALAVG